jgi:hypothetical protein
VVSEAEGDEMSMSSTDRLYISTADFNAPYDGAHFLQGVGAVAYDPKGGVFGPGGHGGGIFQTTVSGLGAWPKGRSYWSTANFRAPYDQGYFQDNNLMGLGSMEDVKVVLRQVPTWAYLVAGGAASFVAWKAYQKGKKGKKAAA